MARRFRPTDAFVDESIRGQRYLMAYVLVEAQHLAGARHAVRELAPPGGRLHFHQELNSVRREVLETVARLPVQIALVTCQRRHGITEFMAREHCLTEIVRDLQSRSVPRLTIESRQHDLDDQRTVVRTRLAEPSLVFDHRLGPTEPMLWIADAAAWALGAGPLWAGLIDAVIDRVVELRP